MATSDIKKGPLYVDSTNNRVGVGTASPDFKVEIVGGTNNGLHIKDAESATVFGGLFTQSANLALVARSNHALTLGTNDAERLRIDSSGNVGIGISSPATKLHVATVANTGLLVSSTDGTTLKGIVFNTNDNQFTVGTQTNHPVAFFSNNTERMRIDSSGNVNIGGAADAGNTLRYSDIYNTNTGANAGSIIRLITSNAAGSGTTTGELVKYKSGLLALVNSEPSATAQTAFYVAGAERMRIDNGGNVAIGTSSFSNKLHVESAGANYIVSRDSTSGGTAGVLLQNGSDTRGIRISGGDIQLHDHSANLTRLNIDSSGRVTMPYQPCFYAYKSNGDISSTTPVVYVFNNSIVNVGNHYSTSTGRYTAGVAGNYHFSCQILNRNTTGGARIHFYKNGSPYFTVGTATSATYYSISGEATQGASAIIYLAAGDYVEIRVWNTNGDFYGSGNIHNSFSGFLIG